MPRVRKASDIRELTPQERRERRQLRREKQRENNIARAAKMHQARLKMEVASAKMSAAWLNKSVYVGCSGWRYWKWRNSFYVDVPQPQWFDYYSEAFDTVEINASFYSWPTVANVQSWRRQPGDRKFVSGPRLPDELIRTADDVYVRLHGPKRWYRHDYSDEELEEWANRIEASGAKKAWIYFNNDYAANAPKNARSMQGPLVRRSWPTQRPVCG